MLRDDLDRIRIEVEAKELRPARLILAFPSGWKSSSTRRSKRTAKRATRMCRSCALTLRPCNPK